MPTIGEYLSQPAWVGRYVIILFNGVEYNLKMKGLTRLHIEFIVKSMPAVHINKKSHLISSLHETESLTHQQIISSKLT